MRNKLLILDKDGTLTTTVSGEKFVQHPKDQQLLPGVAEALQRYADNGWQSVIASNQGGVAAGYKSLDEAIREMRFCWGLIPAINRIYFCPDLEYGENCHVLKCRHQWLDWTTSGKEWLCDGFGDNPYDSFGGYRKPNPGMIKAAIRDFFGMNAVDLLALTKPFEGNIPLRLYRTNQANILFIGDRPEDEQAAANAGIPFMWAHEWRGE